MNVGLIFINNNMLININIKNYNLKLNKLYKLNYISKNFKNYLLMVKLIKQFGLIK